MLLKKSIDIILILTVSALAIFLIKIAFFNLENFQFASDLFRHFSSIRNIYDGIGPYEGPVKQYTFGTHTFFIFYLISPLLFFLKDPKLLIVINILSVCLSVPLIYLIAKKIFCKIDKYNFLSLLVAVSYMFFPTLFKGYFYQPYGFQADTLATPLFLLLFYFYLLKKFYFFLFFSIIILSIKEEFLLIYPALIILIFYISYLFNLKGFDVTKKKIILISIIYLSSFILIIKTLSYFSNLNNFDYIPPFWEKNSFDIYYLYLILLKFLKIIFPISPIILILSFYSKFDKKIIIGILFILIATFLRVVENVIIYATPNGSPWANLILAPIFFVILISIIKRYFEINFTNKKPVFFGIYLIIFFSFINNYFAVPSIKTSVDFYSDHIENIDFKREVELVNSKLIKKNKNDYIILPEYFVYPFVNKMNYVHYGYFVDPIKNFEDKKEIIQNAAYILIIKKNQKKIQKYSKLPSKEMVQLTKKHKTKVIETDNLLLFK